jgi:hypothetical protein
MSARSVILGLVFASLTPGALTAQPSPTVDEPYLAEAPDACSYLTQPVASELLRAEARAHVASFHIPVWSQCLFTGEGRQVTFSFKFMVWDLFDVATLDRMSIEFNAQFTAGGVAPSETIEDLGKISFVFEDRALTRLVMVTGIQGAPDGAGRPSEFVATYDLTDPDRPHAEKLAELQDLARRHLAEWLGQAR